MIKIEKKEVGWKVTTDDDTYYIGEYASDGCMCEGVTYRDSQAFESGEGVCYINEYGFDNSEQNGGELFEFSAKMAATNSIVNNPYVATSGYTRKDFENICEDYGYDKSEAECLFAGCWWQAPETYIEEWED